MNQPTTRRQFFKQVAAACVAAVVAPVVLVKKKPVPKKMTFEEGADYYREIICKARQMRVSYGDQYVLYNRRLSGYIVTPYENPTTKTR